MILLASMAAKSGAWRDRRNAGQNWLQALTMLPGDQLASSVEELLAVQPAEGSGWKAALRLVSTHGPVPVLAGISLPFFMLSAGLWGIARVASRVNGFRLRFGKPSALLERLARESPEIIARHEAFEIARLTEKSKIASGTSIRI